MNYIFSNNLEGPDPSFKSRNYIFQFLESLRRINYKDKVVILTESNDRLKHIIYGLDVTLLSINDLKIEYPIYGCNSVEYINTTRYYYYLNYINENNIKNEDNILCVDSRDVLFQTNPFERMITKNLMFSEEPLPFFNSWSAEQFRIYETIEPNWFSLLKNIDGFTINSNFIGGVGNFKKLVNDLTNEILFLCSKEKNKVITDQVLINKLLTINKIHYATVLPYDNNLIVSNLIEEKYSYENNIVYNNNTPISIIHQYDRNEFLLEKLLKNYATL